MGKNVSEAYKNEKREYIYKWALTFSESTAEMMAEQIHKGSVGICECTFVTRAFMHTYIREKCVHHVRMHITRWCIYIYTYKESEHSICIRYTRGRKMGMCIICSVLCVWLRIALSIYNIEKDNIYI